MPVAQPTTIMHFRLTLAGREMAGLFSACSGLESETAVIEEKAVDDQGRPVVRKVAGPTKWANITLRRGIDQNLDLWQWREDVVRRGPDKARVDGQIELLDYEGNVITTYRFKKAWPVKYSGAALNAGAGDVAVETIEICHEGLERV
jgi:phage tail-like protein